MDFLTWFVIVPVLTVTAIIFTKNMHQTRMAAAIGMSVQLILAIVLVFIYLAERRAGNTAEMLFMHSYTWFESLNITYTIGVDGISVAMIMLTGVIVFTGIFASWSVDFLSKEFFISLILLSSGVFGFFISI